MDEDILIPIAVCVVLPIFIVAIVTFAGVNRDNKRSKIMLAAIEKGMDVDAKNLFESDKKKKTLKERVMGYLSKGLVCLAVGIALVISNFMIDLEGTPLIGGLICGLIGVAYVILYFVFRKSLPANETEPCEDK